jgi:PncC family amidohydrolase
MFDKDLINNIKEELIENHQSIAAAESVTAGLIQAALASADDASLFFQGGITAYNVGQKCRHLLVEPLHALECDSVSERVAQDMSIQVCTLFTSDYGIGITGYAAKVPEKNINELYAYYAISLKEKIIDSGKVNAKTEEGLPAQLFYVHTALNKLRVALKNEHDKIKIRSTG